jgi:hypothetical protein
MATQKAGIHDVAEEPEQDVPANTMTEREHAHILIDCLPEPQLCALVVLLETIVKPEEVTLGNAHRRRT